MSLTPNQIDLIRSTVPVLKEHGQAITISFYDTSVPNPCPLTHVRTLKPTMTTTASSAKCPP